MSEIFEQDYHSLSTKMDRHEEKEKEGFSLIDYQSLSSLGYMLMRMGRNDDAQKTFSALLKLAIDEKQKNWLYKNLAVVYIRKEEYKLALEALRNAIGDGVYKKQDAYLYLLKAEALWQSSRFNEAEASIKQYYNLIA